MRNLALSVAVLGLLAGLACDSGKKEPVAEGPAPIVKPAAPMKVAKDILPHLQWLAKSKDLEVLEGMVPDNKAIVPGNGVYFHSTANTLDVPGVTPEMAEKYGIKDYTKFLADKKDKEMDKFKAVARDPKAKPGKNQPKDEQWAGIYKAGIYRCTMALHEDVWKDLKVTGSAPDPDAGKDAEKVNLSLDNKPVVTVKVQKKADGTMSLLLVQYLVNPTGMKKVEAPK